MINVYGPAWAWSSPSFVKPLSVRYRELMTPACKHAVGVLINLGKSSF